MATTIRRATAGDLSSIVNVHFAALEKTNDFYAAFLRVNPKDVLTESTGKALNNGDDIFLVAERNQVGIIGYATCTLEAGQQDKSDEPEELESSTDDTPRPSVAKDHLREVWNRFLQEQGPLNEAYENATKTLKHLYINHIMVHPNYQRHGVGKSLLSTVLALAAEQKLDTFLVSSIESHRMFLDSGFQDVGTCWKIDNGYWMREIQKVEGEGSANEMLVRKFEGVWEIECLMKKGAV